MSETVSIPRAKVQQILECLDRIESILRGENT